MKYVFFEDAHPVTKLIFAVFLAFAAVIVFSGISAFLSMFIFNIDLIHINDHLNTENPENIPFVKFFQSFYSIGMFLAPAVLAAFFFSLKPFKFLFIDRVPELKISLIVILSILFAIPLINYLGLINSKIELPAYFSDLDEKLEKSVIALLKVDSTIGLIINIFIIALLPALGEELFFRGVIQRIFLDWFKNKHLAILTTAIIFSAFHFQFAGFIPRMILGMFFGYLLVWSENIWYPIIAHFLNNGIAVISFHLFYGTEYFTKAENIGTENNQILLLISCLALLSLLLIVYRNYFTARKNISLNLPQQEDINDINPNND